MRMPTNGSSTNSTIQPAFAHPDMSERRTSANSAMNIHMTANQKKNVSIAHRKYPNVHVIVYSCHPTHVGTIVVVGGDRQAPSGPVGLRARAPPGAAGRAAG